MKISIMDNNKNIYEDFIEVTPVLTKKILDCVNVKIERYGDINNVDFTLADLGIDYIDNALVSLEQISYSYDFLGLKNNPVKGRIGNCEIDLYGVHGVITDSGTDQYKIFDEYEGSSPDVYLQDLTEKIIFIERNLEFEVINLVIYIQGCIGNEPFMGTYTYSGSLL